MLACITKNSKGVLSMKRLGLIMFILLLSITLVACGETTTPEKVDTAASVDSSKPTKEKPAAETFAIGDTVKMGDLSITVNGARFDAGGEYSKPEAGQKWLVIDCTIENTGAESASLSSLMMFKLFDEESFAKDMDFMATTSGSLDGEVGAGRKIRGEIAYNVGVDQSAWEFIFEPNVFGKGQAIFNIENVK